MSIESWLQSLSDAQRDQLTQMLNDMRLSITPERMTRLEKKLAKLKGQIDRANSKREALSDQVEIIQGLQQSLADRCRQNGDDAALVLLSSVLADRLNYLRGVMAALKPGDKLREKHDLIALLEQLNTFGQVTTVLEKALSACRDEKVSG